MKNKIIGEEKHYQKLNKRLQQELNQLKTVYNTSTLDNQALRDIIYKLQAELVKNKEENQLLKNNQNLSDEEIKSLLKASKSMNMIVEMGKMTGMF